MDIGTSTYEFKFPEIEDIWYIMMALSNSAFSTPEVSVGNKGTYMFSCETMMSAMNTLVSIDFCGGRRAYSDAYTLIRKYRDDLMQYLFVLNVIQNIHGLNEQEFNIFELNEQELLKIIEQDFYVLASGITKNDAEFAMEAWIYNELDNQKSKTIRKNFFDTSKYKNYLMSNNVHVEFIMKNYLNEIWKGEDRKLNNYVHTNGLMYLTNNYAFQFNVNQQKSQLVSTIRNITSIFLSLLAVIDSKKMHSSDYLDACEMGMQPEEGSQYWVCAGIVEYMDEYLDKDLLLYIQKNENNGMKFLREYY